MHSASAFLVQQGLAVSINSGDVFSHTSTHRQTNTARFTLKQGNKLPDLASVLKYLPSPHTFRKKTLHHRTPGLNGSTTR